MSAQRLVPINRHNYLPFLKQTKRRLAIINFHSKECIPCKTIMKHYEFWAKEYDNVIFGHVEYNKENRPLFQQIGITTWPTLHVILDEDRIFETRGVHDVRHIEDILQNWR